MQRSFFAIVLARWRCTTACTRRRLRRSCSWRRCSRCSGADPVLRQPVTAACSNDDECQPGLSYLCDDYKDYVRARRRALLFGNLPQPPIKYEVAAGASDKAVAGATGRAK
eukprot:scaffold85781_cov61-Phaeocystis_antarctica.AAC.3